MALKAVLASLDGLNEALQGEYKKGEDGKFYLDVTDIEDAPAVAGLRQKYRELLDEKKKLQAKYDELGITPEELADLRDKAANAGKGVNAEKLAEMENKLAEVRKNAEKAIAEAKAEAEKEREALRRTEKQRVIATAIAEAKANPKLGKHIEDMIDVRMREDGTFETVVLKDGQPRIKGVMGDLMGVSDLLSELKESDDWSIFFAPEGKGGSGANPGGSAGGTNNSGVNPFKKETRNVTEQMRLAKENPAKARELAAAAGVQLPKVA